MTKLTSPTTAATRAAARPLVMPSCGDGEQLAADITQAAQTAINIERKLFLFITQVSPYAHDAVVKGRLYWKKLT
jgi:hypothetical protein